MPHFGPRKVGEAAFKISKLKEQKTKKFGARKFGARKAAEMQAAIDAAEQEVEAPVVEETDVEAATTSLKQLREALDDNPAVADELFELELARPNGPRAGAVKLFLATEMSREDGPRAERQAQLEELLKT